MRQAPPSMQLTFSFVDSEDPVGDGKDFHTLWVYSLEVKREDGTTIFKAKADEEQQPVEEEPLERERERTGRIVGRRNRVLRARDSRGPR